MAAATKATALAAAAVVADMAAALAAKAPVAVAVAVVVADVDAAALVATADRLGVKRFWSLQEKGLCGALFYARKNKVTKGSGPIWRLQWP